MGGWGVAWGNGRTNEFRSQGPQALEHHVILNIYSSTNIINGLSIGGMAMNKIHQVLLSKILYTSGNYKKKNKAG